MIYNSKTVESAAVIETAKRMCVAARTAPKARGIDHIHTCAITGDDLLRLADEMEKLGKLHDIPIFSRDANNVRNSDALVAIGAVYKQRGLTFCQYCGFDSCSDCAKANATCVYDNVDLGIALGSAAALAADSRVDSRVLYTAGKAILSMGLFDPEVKIAFGIPISAHGKSPYFDRK